MLNTCRAGEEVVTVHLHSPEYHELADYYDLLNEAYIEYGEQCRFVHSALERYGVSARRVLDLGCGSGAHALLLAKAGLDVVGIDLSAELLAKARLKSMFQDADIGLVRGDIRKSPFAQVFDVALGLNFAATLFVANEDLRAFIGGAAEVLKPGGLVMLDFLSEYERDALTAVEGVDAGYVTIDCIREFDHDRARQVVKENMMYYVERDGRIRRYEGSHEWRVLYPQEMKAFLEMDGLFRVLGIHERWDLDANPDGPGWVAIAQRLGAS
jgi:SAM-dependent methyltransferase